MRRGPRPPKLQAPTREKVSMLESALATKKGVVDRHRATIIELKMRIAELEQERDAAAASPPTDIDAARARCVVVSERIARGLEERDDLLDYIFARCPPGEEKRQRLEPTRRSVIRKLRIGPKSNPLFCATCGQSMPGHISAHLFMGFYGEKDGGGLGELFVALGRGYRDSAAGGGYHGFAKAASVALQHGCPEKTLVQQLRYQHDLSGGFPYGPDGPIPGPKVTSLMDFIGIEIERVLEERDPKKVDSKTDTKPDAKESA